MKTYTIRPLILTKRDAEMGSMTYMAYAGRPVMRPWLMWYIKAENKNVLVDTCINADDIPKHHPALKNFQQPVMTFEEALKLVDCSPDDIDIIIQTHLHFDHVYNTGKCKNAEVFVQKKELDFALNPHPIHEISYPTKDLIKKIDFTVIDGDQTILPGISVIFTPGHSPGGQSVVVQTSKGKAVIAGFCCIKENFYVPENEKTKSPFVSYPVIAPTVHTDLFESFESVLRVKNIADILIPSHDPEMALKKQIP